MSPPVPGFTLVPATAQCQLALPALLRVMALVATSRDDLERCIDAELDRNPLLERAPGGACPGCGRHTRRGVCAGCRRARPAGLGERAAGHHPMETLEPQVRAELPAHLRALVEPVLGSLDQRGLATRSVDELAIDLHCPAAAVQRVVDAVQCVGPPGIATPTAAACLLAQAEWVVAQRRAPPVLVAIVQGHLDEVATGDDRAIAAATGAPREEIAEAIHVLRTRLRPWVTWQGDAGADPRPAPPDIIVSTDDTAPHGLRVELTDADWYGLRVVDPPTARAGAVAARWAQPWVRDARSFLRQLDVRSGALRAVANGVVDAQHEYLVGARHAPRPITRTAIASTCGLSLSTVSRVVQGKHLRAPDTRVIPLATLFDPSAAARDEVRRTLHDAPGLTDADVSRRLAAQGHVVARRTVAKYRAQLGITSARTRPPSEATFA